MKRYAVINKDLADYLLNKECNLIKIDLDKKHNTKNLVFIFEDTEELRDYVKEYWKSR